MGDLNLDFLLDNDLKCLSDTLSFKGAILQFKDLLFIAKLFQGTFA